MIKIYISKYHKPEYSMTSSGDFPSTSRAILSISSRPYFSLALINWLKSLLFQFVKPCKQQEFKKALLGRRETFCKVLSYVRIICSNWQSLHNVTVTVVNGLSGFP